MSKGQIQQLGTPLEIYERPVNRFVADFIGDTNFVVVDIAAAPRMAGCAAAAPAASSSWRRPLATSRPAARHAGDPAGEDRAARPRGAHGEIVQSVYIGTDTNYHVRIGDGSRLNVRVQNAVDGGSPFDVGDKVGIDVPSGAARMLQD